MKKLEVVAKKLDPETKKYTRFGPKKTDERAIMPVFLNKFSAKPKKPFEFLLTFQVQAGNAVSLS
jgi:hypothetical protein